LSFLHNYFDGLTKLFSNLYLAKFLDISAKSFFSCTHSDFFILYANKQDLTRFNSETVPSGRCTYLFAW